MIQTERGASNVFGRILKMYGREIIHEFMSNKDICGMDIKLHTSKSVSMVIDVIQVDREVFDWRIQYGSDLYCYVRTNHRCQIIKRIFERSAYRLNDQGRSQLKWMVSFDHIWINHVISWHQGLSWWWGDPTSPYQVEVTTYMDDLIDERLSIFSV